MRASLLVSLVVAYRKNADDSFESPAASFWSLWDSLAADGSRWVDKKHGALAAAVFEFNAARRSLRITEQQLEQAIDAEVQRRLKETDRG